VQVVIDCLKNKLPGPLSSHLDSFITGGTSGGIDTLEGEASEQLKDKLSGLFGGSKA
jgi:hypothetical protein